MFAKKTKPKYAVGVSVIVMCPCGKQIFATSAAAKILAVVHEQPMCGKFLELDPVEFLAYVRRSRGIPDSST